VPSEVAAAGVEDFVIIAHIDGFRFGMLKAEAVGLRSLRRWWTLVKRLANLGNASKEPNLQNAGR
jgi:hypothetical protein